METVHLSLADAVKTQFPERVIAIHHYRGQGTVVLAREGLLEVARFLRDDPAMRFDLLMDLTCVDYARFGRTPSSAPTLATPSPLPYAMTPAPSAERWERGISNDACRFDVVYHVYSVAHNHRLRVKVPLVAADPVVESLTDLWASANWFEREAWDMFGVVFRGHPNLTRLLLYEEFHGHPLRKDYPTNKRQPLIGPLN